MTEIALVVVAVSMLAAFSIVGGTLIGVPCDDWLGIDVRKDTYQRSVAKAYLRNILVSLLVTAIVATFTEYETWLRLLTFGGVPLLWLLWGFTCENTGRLEHFSTREMRAINVVLSTAVGVVVAALAWGPTKATLDTINGW